jgi:hypothetical protein
MSQVNYKQKYQQLKQRFMESVDVAFRLGYEQGAQQAQMQQMQQQQQQVADQQSQEAQSTAQGSEDPSQDGQPGQEGQQPDGAQIQDSSRGVGQQAQGAGGSELDSHIGELEGLMAKAEYGTESWETLNNSIAKLKSIKVSLDLKKNEALIKSIGANLKAKKPLVLNPRAKHNLTEPAKAALTMQHKIVEGIMETMEKESQGLPTDIVEILRFEGLTKKE